MFFIIFALCVFVACFANSLDLKKFFFYSEITWLLIFTVILVGFGTNLNTNLLIQAFLILALTACEAVTLAAFLLILSETKNTTFKNDN